MTEPPRDLPFFPDFFVIGAPRCGTTSLSAYLRKHPQICFSRPKEPHYFSKLVPAFGLASIRDRYLGRCFATYDPAVHQAIGEGSVSYLYSVEAIETILAFNPQARFIVMVRNPLAMLPSYHARMLFIMQEDETSFARAWDLQEARARGEHLPRHCLDPEVLRYRDVARYAELLRRLFSIVDRERCLVLVFDDFVRDPRAVYEHSLAFLGVPSDGRSAFRTRQPSRRYRYAWLQRLVYPPLGTMIRFTAEVERRASVRPGSPRREARSRPSMIKTLRKRLRDWNTSKAKPEPLSPLMRDTLRAAFAADVEDLGTLLQRDLSHWLRPPAVAAHAVDQLPLRRLG